MTIESRPIDAKAPSYIDREKWEPCLNCQDIEKLSKHIKCWHSYCPVCGRPLTDEAWDELEKRLSGCLEKEKIMDENKTRNQS